MNDFQMYEEGRKEAEAKQCDIHVVSVSFIEQIKKQIEYHKEQEATRASVKDYGQAIYHNNRRGALEDLLVWIKLNER
jgi:uncharacterized protein YqfB (UPF0267 family)